MPQYRVSYRCFAKDVVIGSFVGVFNAADAADACDQASRAEVPDDEPYLPQMTVRESVRLALVATPVESLVPEDEK